MMSLTFTLFDSTEAEVRKASLTACDFARDAEEAAEFLKALGLIEDPQSS